MMALRRESRLPYQVLFVGDETDQRRRVKESLFDRLRDLGLTADAISFFDQADEANLDPRMPLMAVYFGSRSHAVDSPLVGQLIEDSITIATVVSSLDSVSMELPPQLRHINAIKNDAVAIDRLTNLILETFRLLRRERRLFISYKRSDSQAFADKLYEELDARGFDVFIDVRSVPPGVDFQAELWHRMSDSDVVILIDTPGFRESRWTTAELAQANATNIQILHLLWPGQTEDDDLALSYFESLTHEDFYADEIEQGTSVKPETLTRIYAKAELLRARAIAARYRYLVDNFCDAARDARLAPAVQPERWISIDGPQSGQKLAVIAAIGVPTSNLINKLFMEISNFAGEGLKLWVIYDDRGVLNSWLDHLNWLDQHLPIRVMSMVKAPALLQDFAS